MTRPMGAYTLNAMKVLTDDKRIESCAECTCFNLRKASRVITQIFDRALRPAGLRGTQFSILAVLSAAGSVTISGLSNMLFMDRTSLTRSLRPMEKAGLVRIEQGEDLRNKMVSVTPKGEKAFAKTFASWEKAQNRIIEKLGRERFNSMIRDLQEISDMFSVRKSGV